MVKNKTFFQSLLCFLIFLFSSCQLLAKDSVPYLIDGKMVIEESTEYQIAGFDFYLLNKSEKQISSFTVVFYLFDEDGNPPDYVKNSIVLTVKADVDSHDYLESCISLDKFFSSIPESPYTIDYLYISKIKYSDDSEWNDPFGLQVF